MESAEARASVSRLEASLASESAARLAADQRAGAARADADRARADADRLRTEFESLRAELDRLRSELDRAPGPGPGPMASQSYGSNSRPPGLTAAGGAGGSNSVVSASALSHIRNRF